MASLPRFDIFSGEPDKNPLWIESVEGLGNANERMKHLAAQKPGKYFIFYIHTREVVATVETFATPETARKSGTSAA